MSTPDAPYELEDALTRAAAGLYPAEAAVRLLVEHGFWVAPLAYFGFIEMSDADVDVDVDDPLGARYARVDWPGAVTALDTGSLYGGRSAGRVLRIAAGLGGAVPVNLSDALSGLDRTNLALVLAAISHANGCHKQREYVIDLAADNAPRVARPANRWVDLGPLYPWPAQE